ncbi:type VI secretion system ImpA domain-containing protein [Salinibacter sp. 10B]|uniref:type VI secretion system protein TssA n=1 Tax=Salinibacter sp. 10B TaxID=1923971 RepID=UPI000D27A9C3|nr:type VI secretion system protein TssA [Salinibacter sp. 10B]PQJ33912.1 type VI secretion system ImpA domain-containing protein [Salinibacter sp. 10B]
MGNLDTAAVEEGASDDSNPEDSASVLEANVDVSSSPFLTALRSPIREDAPAGEDVLYGEDFQQLKTEINKISSAAGTADYDQIVELARTVLTEQSKDLRAAGYLVVGEARVNGVEGAAEAVQALHLLIDEYWESLYPEKSRMRSRGNALQFVADRLPDWIQAVSIEASDREALVRISDVLEDIQAFSMEEMGEHAPSLSGLLNDLEDEIDELPAPEPSPDDASDEEPAASEGNEADTEQARSTEGAPEPETIASETDATQTIRRTATYYRGESLKSTISYRLIRAVRWGTMQSLPPNEGGTTRFSPPRDQRRKYLKGLLEKEAYETLVEEAESSFQGGTFHVWLDLQRLVAAALKALGPQYEEAHTAVLIELAVFVERLPEMVSLTFKDGTPFASGLTRDWIETEVHPLLEGEPQAGTQNEETEGGAVDADYEEARRALGGGALEDALVILEEGSSQDASKQEAFRRRLYVASLCVKGDRPRIARALLDELVADVQEHNLSVWNPALAIKVWSNRYQCYDQLAESAPDDTAQSFRREANASFEKICQLEPTKAVSITAHPTS